MQKLSIKTIGQKIAQAGKLKADILCIYGSDSVPNNVIPSTKINRCIANAIFTLSIKSDLKGIYIGPDLFEECCPGGQAWFGFSGFSPAIKYFVSTGSKNVMGGAAEYLVASPELAEKRMKSLGTIIPLGKNIIIRKYSDIFEENLDIMAILCFGPSENIRNLCTLAYFSEYHAFDLIQMPMGPSCASFVSFPTGMVEFAPKKCIIVGPTDPTGNNWFPPEYLSLGIPIELASLMVRDLENTFLVKRTHIAFPSKRINLF